MLHLTNCPVCDHEFVIPCEKFGNPFRNFDAKLSMHKSEVELETDMPLIMPPPAPTVSVLKMLFLLDLIGGNLPDLDELPKLPEYIDMFLNEASEDEVKHLIIRVVGQWDQMVDRV